MKLFEKLISAQYRQPAGLLGRWIGKQMAADHLPENLWTAALLQPGPADHILEVGFGPGSAIETLYRNPVQNCVSRPDPRRRFLPDHVEYGAPAECSCDPAGIFDLYCADAAGLPFAEGTFDKAYSIHSIYFWPQPVRVMEEVLRVLKPGWVLVINAAAHSFVVLPSQ